jgi:hypothetical protein
MVILICVDCMTQMSVALLGREPLNSHRRQLLAQFYKDTLLWRNISYTNV